MATNAAHLAAKLSVERRWAVSGSECALLYHGHDQGIFCFWLINLAPTKHLQQGGEIELDLPSRSITPTGLGPSMTITTARPWSRRDIDDVTRLGVMIGRFLAVQPYRSEVAFQEMVTADLRRKSGPRFGAVRRLKELMGALMVKHQYVISDTAGQSTRKLMM